MDDRESIAAWLAAQGYEHLAKGVREGEDRGQYLTYAQRNRLIWERSFAGETGVNIAKDMKMNPHRVHHIIAREYERAWKDERRSLLLAKREERLRDQS